jgi:4-amino-4-deoxy-L-arabinose transferase-like glycosyltransferase
MKILSSEKLLISLIIILAAFTRFYKLGEYSFWFDEILTAIDVNENYGNFFVNPLERKEYPLWSWDHPPLYFILAKISVRLFGESEFSYRLPSALFGIFTIIIMYFFAKRYIGKNIAIIACLLMCLSPFVIRYTQEARPYGQLLFYISSSFMFLANALSGRKYEYFWWAGWILSTLFGFYSHYFSIAIWFIQCIIVDIVRNHKKTFLFMVASSLVTWVLYIPWFPHLMIFLAKPLGGGASSRIELFRQIFDLIIMEFFYSKKLLFWLFLIFSNLLNNIN